MKYVVIIICVLVLQISCSQDDNKPVKTSAISFSLTSLQRINGRVADSGTPAAVLLSIKDADGNLVYENKKLSLFTFGQGYMSESVQMKVVGSATDYTLVTFLVLDANGKTLYASPTAGSPKAQLVSKPLPLRFTISENDNAAIVPEVLAVDDTDTPESFGYASFGFEVVKVKRLESIEYFEFNTVNFEPVYKIFLKYQKGKLVQIDLLDYNTTAHSYVESTYVFRKYEYDAAGLLVRGIRLIGGGSDLSWVDEYEYSGDNLVKITEYETNGVFKTPLEHKTIERTQSAIQVKYYDGHNSQYAQADGTLDERGNIITLKASSLPNPIQYKYDNKPNPEYMIDPSGDYPFIQHFFSRNNVISNTTASGWDDTVIEYDADGYPVKISNSYSKKIYTYQ